MKTIGFFLQQARRRHKISILRLSVATKIKPKFLVALEKEQWGVFPNFVVAQGFVRSVSGAIGVDPETSLALLRRDYYHPQEVEVSQLSRAWWTPRTTIIIIVSVLSTVLVFYLANQYLTYVAPPPLSTTIGRNGETVEINGSTHKEAQVLIDGEPVLVEENGNFRITIAGKPGQTVTLEARSRGGQVTKKEIVIP